MTTLASSILALSLLSPAEFHNPNSEPGRSLLDIVQTNSGPVNIEHLATLNEPWGMTYLPDGRILLTEKPGRMRTFSGGELSDPISGLPRISYEGQGGLMDVEIDPNFPRNRLVYFYFIEAAKVQPANARDPWDPRLGDKPNPVNVVLKGGAVARGRLDGNSLRDVQVIWRQVPKTIGRGHFGGRLAFGSDGKLWITSGDRQRFTPAQDTTSNLGKIVRINSDGSIPRDNPFVARRGARGDIWSMGHRNPLGAAIHPTTGQLWMHEMGPWHGDELNIPGKGQNYGWPIVSNGNNYNGEPIPDHPTQPRFVPPIYYWHPAISPSGLMFYTGNRFRDWRGNLFIGGLSSQALIRLKLEGNIVREDERINLHKRIRDMMQAPDGSILLLTDSKNGELLRMTP